MILKVSQSKEHGEIFKLSTAELILKLTGKDICVCSICNGKMIRKEKLEPTLSRPPNKVLKTS